MKDTYIYIQEFEDGYIRYGITNNIDKRMRDHRRNFGDTFTWALMVEHPVSRSVAKTIEALLIQQAFDNNIPCKNNHIENKRYIFKNKDYLDSCPICEDIGCNISSEYIDNLIKEHKEKIREYQKAYQEANGKKLREQWKAYYDTNKEKIREYQKAYRDTNQEKLKEQKKAWRENNKEYDKAYRESNKDRLKAYNKVWRENNKDKISEYKPRKIMLQKIRRYCKKHGIKWNIRKLTLIEGGK